MLLFSEYDRTLKNISISQPMVDVDIEDTNSLIIRYPKFKRVTHLILSYDAQNLFTKEKSGYGYFMDLENILQEQEDKTKKDQGKKVMDKGGNDSQIQKSLSLTNSKGSYDVFQDEGSDEYDVGYEKWAK